MNSNFRSPTVGDLSESLVAISIEDTESDTQKSQATKHIAAAADDDEVKKDEEQLLPNKMGYEWKEITNEFFEAVKGNATAICSMFDLRCCYQIIKL